LESPYVIAVEELLKKGDDWYKACVVWAGEYADKEPGLLLRDDSEANLYQFCDEQEQG
jgi:hypothetical protein